MQHRNIPSTESHEPKGIEAAPLGAAYVSNGDGTGTWTPQIIAAVMWANVYQTGVEYSKDMMVRDNSWTMIANKLTHDKPSPIEIGSAVSGFTVDPTFASPIFTGTVVSGNTYTFTKSGWIKKVSIKVPAIGGDITYKLYVTNLTDPQNPVVTVIPLPTITAATWEVVLIDSLLVHIGSVLEMSLQAINSSSSTSVTGSWTCAGKNNNANPVDTQWNRDNANATVRVAKLDLDSTDRTSELLGVISGSTILINDAAAHSNYYEYTVTSVTESGNSIVYGVILEKTGGTGPTQDVTTSFTATIPVAASTEYYEEIDYFLTNTVPFASVKGHLKEGYTVATDADTCAFGIDLTFQEGSLSPDWDIVAHSA